MALGPVEVLAGLGDLLSSRELVSAVLRDRPKFHGGGTGCYKLSKEVLYYLHDSLSEGNKTLETGAGVSTLVFALKRCEHIAVTPKTDEIERIKLYAKNKHIPLERVRFVAKPSERYLPGAEDSGMDLVLIDGNHSFPWPLLDWFYTADRLKRGGRMVIDDINLPAVKSLAQFLLSDPKRWRKSASFKRRTAVFEKLTDVALDVNGDREWKEVYSWRRLINLKVL